MKSCNKQVCGLSPGSRRTLALTRWNLDDSFAVVHRHIETCQLDGATLVTWIQRENCHQQRYSEFRKRNRFKYLLKTMVLAGLTGEATVPTVPQSVLLGEKNLC